MRPVSETKRERAGNGRVHYLCNTPLRTSLLSSPRGINYVIKAQGVSFSERHKLSIVLTGLNFCGPKYQRQTQMSSGMPFAAIRVNE